MSMGASYVAMHQNTLEELLSNPEVSLSDFVFDESNEPLLSLYSLEQAWDAFRCLFNDELPWLTGDELLEDVDLGEACFLISADQVSSLAAQLSGWRVDKLKKRFESEDYQAADIYWAETWKKDFEGLSQLFDGLVKYFDAAAKRGDAMLFYMC